MGPYCKFCNNRCFSHLPSGTPKKYLDKIKAMGYQSLILSNCQGGQKFDKEKLGFNISEVRAEIKDRQEIEEEGRLADEEARLAITESQIERPRGATVAGNAREVWYNY